MFEQYSEEEYEEMFQKLKKYINLNPGTTKAQTSRATGISLEVIDKFIEDGRLELKFGTMGLQGSNPRRMSEERRKELAQAFQKEWQNGQKSRDNQSGSQLVKDLDQKYRDDRDYR